jgi:hypothetical protein
MTIPLGEHEKRIRQAEIASWTKPTPSQHMILDIADRLLSVGGVPLFAAVDQRTFASGRVCSKFIGEPLQDDRHTSSFLEHLTDLFGPLHENSKFTIGVRHWLRSAQTHSDDNATAKAAGQLFLTLLPEAKKEACLFTSADLKGNIVCIGDAHSNIIPRAVLQYAPVTDDQDKFLTRRKPILFKLGFETIYDKSYLFANLDRSQQDVIRVCEDGQYYTINWSILDLRRSGAKKIFAPTINRNKYLESDFLLVTVLPNILDKESHQTNKIIIFGGTHGIGTRALSLLLRDQELLAHIGKVVAGFAHAPGWQVLLKVDAIERNAYEERPLSFDRKEVQCCPVAIDELELKKLKEWWQRTANFETVKRPERLSTEERIAFGASYQEQPRDESYPEEGSIKISRQFDRNLRIVRGWQKDYNDIEYVATSIALPRKEYLERWPNKPKIGTTIAEESRKTEDDFREKSISSDIPDDEKIDIFKEGLSVAREIFEARLLKGITLEEFYNEKAQLIAKKKGVVFESQSKPKEQPLTPPDLSEIPLWQGRKKDGMPLDFIRTHYGQWLSAFGAEQDSVFQNQVRARDPGLIKGVHNQLREEGKSRKLHDFVKTRSARMDRELESINSSDLRQAERLSAAFRRRQYKA